MYVYVGYIPVYMGLSMTTVGDTEKVSVNLVFVDPGGSNPELTFINFSVNI